MQFFFGKIKIYHSIMGFCSLVGGKSAFITGGFRGIGLQIAKEFLNQGFKGVTVLGVNPQRRAKVEKELKAQYGEHKVLALQADVTDNEQLAWAFSTAVAKFKGMDVLVNNAGILKDSVWEKVISINAGGVVAGSLLGIKYMSKHNRGRGGIIVNVSSILGLQEMAACPVYTGTKHFVIGFTRSMATPYWYNLTGIKFMAMCPGITHTDMIEEVGGYILQGFPGLGDLAVKLLGDLPPQNAECVAKGMITLLNHGDNGSIWISEGSEPVYQVEIPDRRTIRKDKGC